MGLELILYHSLLYQLLNKIYLQRNTFFPSLKDASILYYKFLFLRGVIFGELKICLHLMQDITNYVNKMMSTLIQQKNV